MKQSIRPRLYSMAICTPYNAFFNFSLGCFNALSIANIHFLIRDYVVKMQCRWVDFKAAIATAVEKFILIKPASYFCCVGISNRIYTLSIARLTQSFFSPYFYLGRWDFYPFSIALITKRRTEFRAALGKKQTSAFRTKKWLFFRVLPQLHI